MSINSSFANALQKQSSVQKATHSTITVKNTNQPEPERQFAGVYMVVAYGKAFVESNGQTPNGLTVTLDPIFESQLEVIQLTKVISQVLKTKYRQLTQEEVDNLHDPKNKKLSPILKATESKSWLQLKRNAAFYSIHPNREETLWSLFLFNPKINYLSKEDELTFPISTPLKELVKIILEDVKKYPHVLQKHAQ